MACRNSLGGEGPQDGRTSGNLGRSRSKPRGHGLGARAVPSDPIIVGVGTMEMARIVANPQADAAHRAARYRDSTEAGVRAGRNQRLTSKKLVRFDLVRRGQSYWSIPGYGITQIASHVMKNLPAAAAPAIARAMSAEAADRGPVTGRLGDARRSLFGPGLPHRCPDVFDIQPLAGEELLLLPPAESPPDIGRRRHAAPLPAF
jgi:hypothetical protein